MNVRKLAVEALDKILDKGAYSNIIVNEYLSKFELSSEDKGLFTNLIYGTLQNLITIEYYLEPFLVKKKPKHYIMNLLCMAVYQIVYLDIPNYAILDETVKIARLKDERIASFVNGVLRNFLRNPLNDIEELKIKGNNMRYLSVKYSHPEWLIAFFLKDYKMECLEQILAENNKVKYDAIRVNTLKSDKETVIKNLEENNIPYENIDIVKNGLIIKKPIFETEMFKNGLVTIQDISSQMVSEIANPDKNSIIIDLCSAPGGKSAHLAAIMNNTGRIFSCDVYPNKIKLMKDLFKRLGVTNATCEQIDAREVSSIVKEESFDYVIADVPCSGLGVISHKIDLKYRINLDSINEIIALQKEILAKTKDLVKKGGYYIYSTCTINKDENEKMIKAFISENNNFEVVFEKQILPQDYHSDGFYICKMRRK